MISPGSAAGCRLRSRVALRLAALWSRRPVRISHGGPGARRGGNRHRQEAPPRSASELKRRTCRTARCSTRVFASPDSNTIVELPSTRPTPRSGPGTTSQPRRSTTPHRLAEGARQRSPGPQGDQVLLVDVTGQRRAGSGRGARPAIAAGKTGDRRSTTRTACLTAARSAEVEYVWVGNTSRDQYSGVIFGLGFAWELIPDDPVVRQLIDARSSTACSAT